MDAAVAVGLGEGAAEGPWALPEGWSWVKLGELGELIRGVNFTKDKVGELGKAGYLPLLRGNNIQDGAVHEVGLVSVDASCVSDDQILRSGDIVLTMSSGSAALIGKSAWIGSLSYGMTFGAFCACFRGNETALSRLVFWFLQTPFYRRRISNSAKGTSINNLKRGHLELLPVPLPPLPEQHRILARVDEIFAEIATGEAALAAARKGLDTFRRALLKAAVTGELTKNWRAANPVTETGHELLSRIAKDRTEEALTKSRGRRNADTPPLDPTALPVLPSGWAWATVRDVGAVQLGRQRAPQHHAGENMRPYLRVANVFEGRIDFSDVKEMNFTPDEFKTYELKPGDILLNEGQTPDLLGRPAMWRGEFRGYCFQNTLLRFQVRAPMNAEFCLLVFRHYLHGKRFKKESQITTNIAHLSSGRFVTIEFPVPPLDEQIEIVRRVSEGLASAADTLAMLDAEAADAARLKQSILKAAFEGRLSRQDPLDESASALLIPLATNPSVVRARRARARKSAS